jgi:O-antigen/teichoic acid export membrane protein
MLCFTAISSTYIFGTLLTANGNLFYLNIMAFGGILLNFVLNIVLIPKFMAMGAAYSSLITQFSTAAIQIWMSFKIFRFPVNKSLILSFVSFMTGVIISVVLTKNLFHSWMINFCIFISLSIILAFATRLINPKNIKKVISFSSAS